MPLVDQPSFTIPIETLHLTKSSNSPLESPVLSGDQLPSPDLSLLHQYSTKKSHARKQPPGHIPRPRNAFILFRSSLVHQNKVPKGVESDHCAISRHAGDLWRHLTKEQKAPWAELADVEKKLHADLYPNYRYNPTSAASGGRSVPLTKKFTFKHHKDHSQKRGELEFPSQAYPLYPSFPPLPPRRSSSCPPPGSEPVKQIATIPSFTSPPTVTRDDLTRRPSRTTMYHAARSEPMGDNSYTFPYQCTNVPPLMTGPYSMALPYDAPGWDAPVPAPTAFNPDADLYLRFLQFKHMHDCNSASVSDIFHNVDPFGGETAAGSELLPAAQNFFSPLDLGGRYSDDQNNTGISNQGYFGAGGSGQVDLLFPGLSPDEDTALQLSSPGHFQLGYPPSGTTPTAVEGEFSI